MTKTTNEPNIYTQLRDRAEAQLQADTKTASTHQWSVGIDALRLLHRLSSNPDSAEDALKLLHELQVHQVELDLQVEEVAANERAAVDDLSFYRNLYDFAPFGYLLIDLEGRVMQGNPAAAELFGVGHDDLEGHPIDTFLLPRSRPQLLDLLQRVAGNDVRNGCPAEAVLSAQGGRHFQLLASMHPGGEHILLACSERTNTDTAR